VPHRPLQGPNTNTAQKGVEILHLTVIIHAIPLLTIGMEAEMRHRVDENTLVENPLLIEDTEIILQIVGMIEDGMTMTDKIVNEATKTKGTMIERDIAMTTIANQIA
jgi:hypothetical protein